MKLRIISAALGALLLVSAPTARAQAPHDPANATQPSERKLELARQLVYATKMDATLIPAFRNMVTQANASMGAGLSPERQARFKVVTDAEGDALAKMVPRIMQDMVDGYARTFSEQELTDMLAFYRSPSGRSMVTKIPQLMQGLMTDMVGLIPQMRRDMGTEVCAKVSCSAAERAAYFGPEPAAAPKPPTP